MTVNYTTLLGLAKPVSGTESGTWGDTVNTNLTDYLDSAVAGAQIISGTQTAVTLSKTTGASLSQAGPSGITGSSQYQIIRCTGNPSSLLTITAPATDKTYVVINATYTSQSVKIVGAGPTTGVTILSGKTSIVAWNGSGFVEVSPSTATTATNLASGSAGTIPYQSASGTTAMLAAGTLGQVLTSAGAAAPTWSTPAAATKTISNKTGAYTVVAGDLGSIINCTSGTFTVSLTAAASLGSGFTCTIWNTGTGAITIDPNAAETIDGVATLVLQQGEGLAVVCNGTNWETDDKKPMRAYSEKYNATYARPTTTGDAATAIGYNAAASGAFSYAIGYNTVSAGSNSIAFGRGASATTDYSTALSTNSAGSGSQAVTGAGAMALGGSYASGTDSFAAAIANNTSTYGAQGSNSLAIGMFSRSNAQGAISIGAYNTANAGGGYPFCLALGYANVSYGNAITIGSGNTVSSFSAGDDGIAIGAGNVLTSHQATAIGNNAKSAFKYSVAIGLYSLTSQYGKYAFAGGCFNGGTVYGQAQSGKIVLRAVTSTSTAVVLTSDEAAASTTNQLIVASGQAMAIQGTLIAKQSGSGNMAGWNITGIVSNNGGTMAVSGLALTAIGSDSITLGAQPTIAVDNTNKGVTITSGYKSATDIRWVATVNTSEVTY